MDTEVKAKRELALKRAYSVDNVLNAKFKGIDLTGKWRQVIGIPEMGKSWMAWGNSGSGKTTLLMQMAKMLSSFDIVLYDSIEEGLSKSIQNAYGRAGLITGDPVRLIDDKFPDLVNRLRRKRSPRIVFIDSIQYTKMRWSDYLEFCEEFDTTLKIWIGHANGKEPKGELADRIRYDSSVRIFTEGYRAFITSRYNEAGKSTMDIWPEGASQYWADINK